MLVFLAIFLTAINYPKAHIAAQDEELGKVRVPYAEGPNSSDLSGLNSVQSDLQVLVSDQIENYQMSRLTGYYSVQQSGIFPSPYTVYPHNADLTDFQFSYTGSGTCTQQPDLSVRCTGNITSLNIEYRYSYDQAPNGMYIDFSTGFRRIAGSFNFDISLSLQYSDQVKFIETDVEPIQNQEGSLAWSATNTNDLTPTIKFRVQAEWANLEVLEQDYQRKIGTPDEWYSKFWLCLNQNACEEYAQTGESGNAGGFNKYMFDYFKAHPANNMLDFKCVPPITLSNIPGVIADLIRYNCFVLTGFLHFEHELRPGFFSYGKLVDESQYDEWDAEHISFVEEHNLPCFTYTLNEAFPDYPIYRAAVIAELQAKTWVSANLLREFVQWYYLWFGANQHELNEETSRLLLNSYPKPPSKNDLFSDELYAALPLKVDAVGGEFFLDVGTSVQLQVTTAQNQLVNHEMPSMTYTVVAPDGNASITENGLLTIHHTSSPFINDRPVIYVIVQNGNDFGIGQFALRDSDNDGDLLADSVEIAFGLNPQIPNEIYSDHDGDGLVDHGELILNSNPLVTDTDQDGFTDNEEYLADSDLLDPNCTPNGCTYPLFLPFVVKP